MKGLILAGGRGTRLRPLTVFTPKPIVPVVNKPFLLYQIEILRRAGIRDITLSLSYQPDKIIAALSNDIELDVDLRYVTEPHQMGTGGAFRFAAEGAPEVTVVLNGDILTDLDLQKIMAFHYSRGSQATIALVPVDDPTRYGLVETGPDGRIIGFYEKPKLEVLTDLNVNTINAGIYILEPSILELIAPGENSSFEYNIFPLILERKIPFFGFVIDRNYWRDIGTPKSYLDAHVALLDGTVEGFVIDRSSHSDIATAANVDRLSVIGEDCVIKPNARILNSVLGPGVHVEEKAHIENSVIWSHSRISTFAEVRDSIVGRSCHIGRNAIVGEGSVLGDKASIPDYSRV